MAGGVHGPCPLMSGGAPGGARNVLGVCNGRTGRVLDGRAEVCHPAARVRTLRPVVGSPPRAQRAAHRRGAGAGQPASTRSRRVTRRRLLARGIVPGRLVSAPQAAPARSLAARRHPEPGRRAAGIETCAAPCRTLDHPRSLARDATPRRAPSCGSAPGGTGCCRRADTRTRPPAACACIGCRSPLRHRTSRRWEWGAQRARRPPRQLAAFFVISTRPSNKPRFVSRLRKAVRHQDEGRHDAQARRRARATKEAGATGHDLTLLGGSLVRRRVTPGRPRRSARRGLCREVPMRAPSRDRARLCQPGGRRRDVARGGPERQIGGGLHHSHIQRTPRAPPPLPRTRTAAAAFPVR